MSSEPFFLKQKSLPLNHGSFTQFSFWGGPAHWMWMDIYLCHCGWVVCCCPDCRLWADPSNSKLVLVFSSQGSSVSPDTHRTCIAWSWCVLFAVSSPDMTLNPMGTCPAPLHFCACGVCLRDGVILRGEVRNLFFTFLINWKRTWCFSSLFFRLHQHNSAEMAAPMLLCISMTHRSRSGGYLTNSLSPVALEVKCVTAVRGLDYWV